MAVFAVALAGCVQNSSPTPSIQNTQIAVVSTTATPTEQPTATSTATPTATATLQAEKEFEMTAKKWEFQPSTITVEKGDKIKLKIKSVDVEHGFKLPDFGVDANLQPGQEVTVEFVADKAGTFTFSCSVFCGDGHRDMKGTLIVEE
ncbi:MAG: cupredoxin domain-containing protein [Candidatus Norongarragalinales archaeon]